MSSPDATAAGFASPAQHLAEELRWVRRVLARYLAVHHQPNEDSQGLYVPAREVARLLHAPPEALAPDARLDSSVDQLREDVDARLSLSHPEQLPWLDVVRAFGLDPLDAQLLVLLAAPAFDSRFARAYCFGWNDFGRKSPSVGFLVDLLAQDLPQQVELLGRLSPGSRLVAAGLVILHDSPGHDLPLRSREVHISGRVLGYILGCRRPEWEEGVHARLLPDSPDEAGLVLSAECAHELRRLEVELSQPDASPWINLWGPRGTGKRRVARQLARGLGLRLVELDLFCVWEHPERLEARLTYALREARLQGALMLLDATSGSAVGKPEGPPLAAGLRLARVLTGFGGPVLVRSFERLQWLEHLGRDLRTLHVPLPGPAERQRMWQTLSPPALGEHLDLSDLALRFALTGGDVAGVVARLRSLVPPGPALPAPAATPPPDLPGSDDDDSAAAPPVDPEHAAALDRLRRAAERECQSALGERLSGIAQRISTGFTWRDVVLPHNTRERLQEVVDFARHQRLVFDEWGFARKFPYGRGLTALFDGPPGTGKTMVATVIARELGLELYRVDLSQIVDKYVGETEKNLTRLFDAAQGVSSVILFDEADSLFTKRTEVKSSVDRYANLEVNHLLQLIERFSGVAILTTNHGEVIDSAFRRRLKFRITFPTPDATARRRLWATMFPEQVQLADDIEWQELAEAFEMSGGPIKNVALRAAVMAAAEGVEVITQDHIWDAASIEYEKMGKLLEGAYR